MSKYEFVISAKDATTQAFASINSGLGAVRKNAGTVAVALTGTTAAFAAMARASIDNARDLDSMAQMAGYNVEEFQALSFAFENFNISQEKFADISKDVQDKLGDFIATGGGGFKDFFEQVAPKVDLTAESLKNLSGADVLIAVKNAMDEANISAKEQVFYMESIASDATALLPALKNNGKSIKDLSDEYKGLNLAISQTEIDKIKDLAIEVEKLDAASAKFRDSLVANLAEPLADAVDSIHSFYTDAVIYLERDFIEIHRWTNEAALGFMRFKQAIGADIDTAEFERLARETEYLAEHYEKLTRRINGEEIDPPVPKVQPTLLSEDRPDDTKLKKEAEAAEDSFLLVVSALDEIQNRSENINFDFGLAPVAEVLGDYDTGIDPVYIPARFSMDDESFSEDAFLKQIGTEGFLNLVPILDLDEATAANQSLIDSTTATFDAIHLENLRFAGLDREIEEERYARQVEQMEREMQLLEDKGLLTQELKDRFNNAELEAYQNHQTRLNDIDKTRNAQLMEGYQALLGILGTYFDGMEGKQAAYARTAIQLTSVLLDEEKRASIESIWANTYKVAMKAFDALAVIPIVGPVLGAAAAAGVVALGGAYTAKVTGLASFDGGGYTGDGPRTGGMDGKGGYLAMLHPQEYVTDFTKGQSLPSQQQQQVHHHYHTTNQITAMDAQSFEKFARDKGEIFAKSISRAQRR